MRLVFRADARHLIQYDARGSHFGGLHAYASAEADDPAKTILQPHRHISEATVKVVGNVKSETDEGKPDATLSNKERVKTSIDDGDCDESRGRSNKQAGLHYRTKNEQTSQRHQCKAQSLSNFEI